MQLQRARTGRRPRTSERPWRTPIGTTRLERPTSSRPTRSRPTRSAHEPEVGRVQTEVLRARRTAGDATALGASLRWVSRFQWLAGDRAEAEASAREASASSPTLDDRALYALALSNEAQLAMLAHDLPRAIELAPRAVAIARETGDRRALSHALNNLGTARLLLNRRRASPSSSRRPRSRRPRNLMDDAARAHVNLVWTLLDQYRLDLAERHLAPALEFSERAEVDRALDLPADRARAPPPRSRRVGRGPRRCRRTAPRRFRTRTASRSRSSAPCGCAGATEGARRPSTRRARRRATSSASCSGRARSPRPCRGGAPARRPRRRRGRSLVPAHAEAVRRWAP